jgi:hypothetical protein
MIAYVEAIAWNFGGILKVVDQKYEDLVVHGCCVHEAKDELQKAPDDRLRMIEAVPAYGCLH